MKNLFTGPEANQILAAYHPQLWKIISGADFPLIAEKTINIEHKRAYLILSKCWIQWKIEPEFLRAMASIPSLLSINTNVTDQPKSIEIIISLIR